MCTLHTQRWSQVGSWICPSKGSQFCEKVLGMNKNVSWSETWFGRLKPWTCGQQEVEPKIGKTWTSSRLVVYPPPPTNYTMAAMAALAVALRPRFGHVVKRQIHLSCLRASEVPEAVEDLIYRRKEKRDLDFAFRSNRKDPFRKDLDEVPQEQRRTRKWRVLELFLKQISFGDNYLQQQ